MRRDGRGSVVMLVPAGVLALLVLAAIAVDGAVVFLAQREVASAAAAAANDAATAVDESAFYGATGDVVIDAARAAGVAQAAVAARSIRGVRIDGAARVVVDGRRVCVEVAGHAPLVVGRALTGHAGVAVSSRATATASETGRAARASSPLCW